MHDYDTLAEAQSLADDGACERDGGVLRDRRAHAAAGVASDMAEGSLEWTPELQLMLAVLDDAIACYRRTLKRPRQNPEILARQAEFWIRLDDWESPFSFNNVCEALGMDPMGTRERVFGLRREVLARR